MLSEICPQISHKLSILLFCVGLVENMVFLIHEIRASETVFAKPAVAQQKGIPAIETIVGICDIVAIVAVLYLITIFTFMGKRNIAAIIAFLEPVSEITIFIVAALDHDIAVLGIGSEIDILTVFIVRSYEAQ